MESNEGENDAQLNDDDDGGESPNTLRGAKSATFLSCGCFNAIWPSPVYSARQVSMNAVVEGRIGAQMLSWRELLC